MGFGGKIRFFEWWAGVYTSMESKDVGPKLSLQLLERIGSLCGCRMEDRFIRILDKIYTRGMAFTL